MPPERRKSKEVVKEEAVAPSVIQPKAKGAKEVKVTATFSRPKRSTATTEASSLPLPKRKASTTAVKPLKRGSDPNGKLDEHIKTKKIKTAPRKAAAPAKVPVSTRKPASSKAKAKLPPFIKANSSSKRPVGRPRGRPRKIAPKPLDTTLLPKTPPPKTPESSSDVDISSILPVNLRRGSTFSVEITKKEDDNAQGLEEETEDEIEEDEEGDERAYWLMKAEPDSRIEKGIDVKFSIDDLMNVKEPEPWNGVRNFAARNNMRLMREGELAFFYHSNCKVPGVAGIMKIVQEHSVDTSALDPNHPYYDAKATEENPRWEVVHVEFKRKFRDIVPLKELKQFSVPGGGLENMTTLKQSRLSVSKVIKNEWDLIVKLADKREAEMAASDPEIKASASNGEL